MPFQAIQRLPCLLAGMPASHTNVQSATSHAIAEALEIPFSELIAETETERAK
jgi:hypothetical protein